MGTYLNEIQFWVEWTIADGNVDAFRSIVTDGNLRVRDEEPGAVSVRSFFSEDGTKCHLFECYEDVTAAMAHISGAAVAEVLPKLGALAEMTRLEVHGALSDELSDLMKALGGAAYSGADGFVR